MDSIAVIVLAAGLGKRMGSPLPKVLARAGGKPLIHYVLETASRLEPERTIVVTGHGREEVERAISEGREAGLYSGRIESAVQKEQRGTGDAAKSALANLQDFTGTVIILYGDSPLVRAATLGKLLELHTRSKATLSLVTLKTSHPNQYGRIVRDPKTHEIGKIVEAKDCTDKELGIDEFNSGIYAVDSAFLKPALDSLTNNNAQGEYYLTDIIEKAVSEGQRVSCLVIRDFEEVQGANDRYELSLIERTLMERRRVSLIQSGVRLVDPGSFFCDPEVEIGEGSIVGPNVQLRGRTRIGKGVKIEGTLVLESCQVDDDAHIKLGVRAEDSVIGKGASVGPFAHLRPGTKLGAKVKVGNFVETKKAVLGANAKASHLTYLGDCTVGEDSNIGAGTITCNYDGYRKFETIIGRDVFIGSNSSLVAPVKIGDGSTVGAGSVITRDVEPDALAVTRAPTTTKPGWSKLKREKYGKPKS